MKRLALLLIIVAFAGCLKGGSPEDTQETPEEPGKVVETNTDQLFGWIMNSNIEPIEGAILTIPSYGMDHVTGTDGLYGFNELPVDTPFTISVEAEGYLSASKSIELRLDSRTVLNFTLQPEPTIEPYMERQSFSGFMQCHMTVKMQGDAQKYECGSFSPQNKNIWDFSVKPGVVGIVFETIWEQDTQLAHDLRIRVDTLGMGANNQQLLEAEGPSVLRAQLGALQSGQFYTDQGGSLRVTVDSGAEIADDEVGVGAGLVVDQEYTVFASVFYHAPPDPSYSVQN